MKYALLLILLTAPGWLLGQSFSLPLNIADSALYLLKVGRACETALTAQALELKAADSLLNAGKHVIRLQDQQITTQGAEISLYRRELRDSKLIWDDQRKKYRQRIRRQKLAIIGMGVLAGALLVF